MAIEELIKQGEALLLDVHEDRFDTYVDYNKFDEYYIHKCTYLYAGKPYVRLGAYESDKVK